MKIDKNNIIHFLLFIVILILMYVVVVKIEQDGAQCTFNPLVYGANQLYESNNKEVMCQCNLLTDNPSPTLYFNHNSSRMEGPDVEVVDSVWDFGVNFSLDPGTYQSTVAE